MLAKRWYTMQGRDLGTQPHRQPSATAGRKDRRCERSCLNVEMIVICGQGGGIALVTGYPRPVETGEGPGRVGRRQIEAERR